MSKLQLVAAAVVFALAGVSNAQDIAAHQPLAAKSSFPIPLTDSELDEITAGTVFTVLIVPPNDRPLRIIETGGPIVLLFGGGQGQDIFGSIVSDRGVKTIPGGN